MGSLSGRQGDHFGASQETIPTEEVLHLSHLCIHHEDCEPDQFCNVKFDGAGFCDPCGACKGINKDGRLNGTCGHCKCCNSHDECPSGAYCWVGCSCDPCFECCRDRNGVDRTCGKCKCSG